MRSEIVLGQREACAARIRELGADTVLLLQDSTDFNFTHHPQTEGMGPLQNGHMRGFWTHNTLAVSPNGVPLGVWDQQVWVREAATSGKSRRRHERSFEEKESYRWATGVPEIGMLPAETGVVTVCDREAHIYEFFDAMLDQGVAFLVRATRGRSTT